MCPCSVVSCPWLPSLPSADVKPKKRTLYRQKLLQPHRHYTVNPTSYSISYHFTSSHRQPLYRRNSLASILTKMPLLRPTRSSVCLSPISILQVPFIFSHCFDSEMNSTLHYSSINGEEIPSLYSTPTISLSLSLSSSL